MTLTSKEGTVLKAGNPREAEGLVKVRFGKNKVYEGVCYGPDHEEQVTEVKPYWARIFNAQGAVEILVDPAAEEDESTAPTLQGIQKLNAKEAAEEIASIDDPRFLTVLEEQELSHPEYDGGRQGVLQAIARRRKELEETGGEGEDESDGDKGSSE